MVRSLRRIIAVGHSLGITLPRRVLRARGLSRGTLVEVVPVEEGLLVRSVTLAPAARAAPPRRHSGAWAALAPLKAGLSRIYGTRLKSVNVYRPDLRGVSGRPASGSRPTRLRVLIVLDVMPDYGSEIERTGDLLSRLSVRHALSISRVFVSARDWTKHRPEGFVAL
jgi:antitoxin component of MazEF toxin-antitoxin module